MIFGEFAVTIPIALALGLAYGSGPCLVSCAPFLTPIFLADNRKAKESWKIILPLSIGRIVGYAALGGVASIMGSYLQELLKKSSYLGFIVGVGMVLIGASLLTRLSPADNCCAANKKITSKKQFLNDKLGVFLPLGLFLLGVSMALNPCLPLGAIFASAALSKDVFHGALLGVSFGVGAVIVPAVAFGFGVSYFTEKLKEQLANYRPMMQKISAVLLLIVGIGNVALSFKS